MTTVEEYIKNFKYEPTTAMKLSSKKLVELYELIYSEKINHT